MSEESVRLETEDTGEVLIIRVLNRRIKYEQSSDLGDQLKQAVSMFEGSNVLLDFGIVEYMTSEALGKLAIARRCGDSDPDQTHCHPPPLPPPS